MSVGTRLGYSTGTCAAAAAKAAALVLAGQGAPCQVELWLPDGSKATLLIAGARRLSDTCAEAAVSKDAGDDPDITHMKEVVVTVERCAGSDIVFAAGEGVGTVTRPGLSLAPGEPAINPVPRSMIAKAIREVLSTGVRVTVSIPGGKELAAKTFNPRLGIVGGLSILGTSGRVRPFSHPALQAALKCSVDVAAASGLRRIVLVPGHIGQRAAMKHFRVAVEQVLEVSNEWGFVVDQVALGPFSDVLVVGHPGKLAKLAAGMWDTHSSKSDSAVPVVASVAREVLARELESTGTVEGLFAALTPPESRKVAEAVAARVVERVKERMCKPSLAVALIDLAGNVLGSSGELSAWR